MTIKEKGKDTNKQDLPFMEGIV